MNLRATQHKVTFVPQCIFLWFCLALSKLMPLLLSELRKAACFLLWKKYSSVPLQACRLYFYVRRPKNKTEPCQLLLVIIIKGKNKNKQGWLWVRNFAFAESSNVGFKDSNFSSEVIKFTFTRLHTCVGTHALMDTHSDMGSSILCNILWKKIYIIFP